MKAEIKQYQTVLNEFVAQYKNNSSLDRKLEALKGIKGTLMEHERRYNSTLSEQYKTKVANIYNAIDKKIAKHQNPAQSEADKSYLRLAVSNGPVSQTKHQPTADKPLEQILGQDKPESETVPAKTSKVLDFYDKAFKPAGSYLGKTYRSTKGKAAMTAMAVIFALTGTLANYGCDYYNKWSAGSTNDKVNDKVIADIAAGKYKQDDHDKKKLEAKNVSDKVSQTKKEDKKTIDYKVDAAEFERINIFNSTHNTPDDFKNPASYKTWNKSKTKADSKKMYKANLGDQEFHLWFDILKAKYDAEDQSLVYKVEQQKQINNPNQYMSLLQFQKDGKNIFLFLESSDKKKDISDYVEKYGDPHSVALYKVFGKTKTGYAVNYVSSVLLGEDIIPGKDKVVEQEAPAPKAEAPAEKPEVKPDPKKTPLEEELMKGLKETTEFDLSEKAKVGGKV